MTIRLQRKSDGAVIELPDDSLWSDEYGWTPISQTREQTITGALIVEESKAQAGRPITLGGEDAWITRERLERLRGWSLEPQVEMQLTLADGRQHDVIFDQTNQPVVGEPIQPKVAPEPDDYYTLTVRLIEV